MFSVSNLSSTRKHRLIRGIALLFLVYTAMDIVLPDLCRGETPRDVRQESVDVNASRFIDKLSSIGPRIEASDNLPTNEPSEQPSDDDCCFCCSSHVLPGTIITSMSVTDVSSATTFLHCLSVASPPLARTFHPPRSA